jgi:RNA polymerase sigma-70 factor (ECF subfamily)
VGRDEARRIDDVRAIGTAVARLSGGEEDAFRSLIEPHRPALHAHCYRMLGSLHDAEDALQNTLLRAWRALPKFRGTSSLGAWLYRIATNVCLDAIARRHKRVLPIDYGPPASPGDAPEKPPSGALWIEPYADETLAGADGDATPAARYERREMLELALIAALQHLSARQRAVLILRDVLGFSAKEVADSLEITVASVNGAILRARRALEEQLLEPSRRATLKRLGDRRLREIVERFADAFERGEVDAILALLAEDPTLKAAGPVFDRPGVSADEPEPAADQRRSSCGYSPTTDSSPASLSRRSSPTSRRRSPTSGGYGRRGSSERTTPAPTNPVS